MRSIPQIRVTKLIVCADFGSWACHYHLAKVKHDCGVGYAKRSHRVLFDQQDGKTPGESKVAHELEYLLHDERGQAKAWLIKE
jgi:hypothetical protein